MNQTIINALQKLVDSINEKIITLRGDGKNKEASPFQFKVRNFLKAIKLIKLYDQEIQNGEQLRSIKGIGDGIIKRVDEIIQTGTLSEIPNNTDTTSNTYDQKQIKIKILKNLQRITGVGPVKAKKLYDDNHTLKSLLEMYSKNDKELSELLTHHQILGVKYFQDLESRIPYGEIQKIEKYIKATCRNIDPNLNLTICGSYRRKQDTSGDIDILITHKDIKTNKDINESDSDYLEELIKVLKQKKFLVDHLTINGNTKYMGFCKYQNNPSRRIDIRLIPTSCYSAALLYFTGSGEFNKNMRTYALKNGYTINEYGIYKLKADKTKGLKIKCDLEEDIFSLLKIKYVLPENRTALVKFD